MTLTIQRHFTMESHDGSNPALITINKKVVKADPSDYVKVPANFLVPDSWSTSSAKIFADKYLRRSGVPSATVPVGEEGVPAFLQPSKPAKNAVTGGETTVAQVMHRMAGAWAYHGFKRGYFDAASAEVFYHEVLYMLLHQMAAPNSPQFFNTGLHWAYGLTGPAQGHYRADPETGVGGLTRNAYEYPQVSACFIQSVDDDLVNPRGIMDLWLREARLFKYGSGTGSNFSKLRGENESLSGGGRSSGMMSFLKIGDVAAGSIKSGGTTRRAAKMVIVDADHPDIEQFINWKAEEELKVAALVAGSRAIAKHAKAVIAAIQGNNGAANADPATNELLKKALKVARREGVPMGTLRPLLKMAAEGIFDLSFPEFDTSFLGEAYATVSGQNANMSVRLTASFMKAVDADSDWVLVRRTDKQPARKVKARQLWNAINRAAWKSADPGLQFHDTINAWHTCKADGDIRASNPCSEYMFLDDTACNLASLNLRKFVNADGSFDVPGYQHAIRLWTLVLDISVTMAQYPALEIAERSHLYRTLGLGYANLGGLLMASGIPYDSQAGRTLCGALTALLTGTAYLTSAEIASVLGPFPRYDANEHYMRVVINNHHAAAINTPDQLIGFSDSIPGPVMLTPVEHDELALKINPLIAAAGELWNNVVADGLLYGFRNAQVSVLAPTGTIGLAMGCDTTGIEPDYALVKIKKLVGGDEITLINQCVESALKAHGYNEADREEILRWTKKHGTPEGCAALRVEHEAIFDCANRCSNGRSPHDPLYHAGVRSLSPAAHVAMVAAAQSFISGAISKTVNMPNEAKVSDVESIHRLAYRSGVKAIAIYRDNSKLSQPLMSGDAIDTALGRDDDEPIVIMPPKPAYPRKAPAIRIGHTAKFGINGQSFYLTTNVYHDTGMPAEIFITTSKEGAAVNTLFSSIARTFSTALQYGVPLEALVDQYLFVKSDPQGMVSDHPWIKNCTSPQDCIARHLAVVFLDRRDLAHVKPDSDDPDLIQCRRVPLGRNSNSYAAGLHATGHLNGHANGHTNGHANGHDHAHANGNGHSNGNGHAGAAFAFPALPAMAKALAPAVDAPYVPAGPQLAISRGYSGNPCSNCGNYTLVRNGTCEKCESCGETSGCS